MTTLTHITLGYSSWEHKKSASYRQNTDWSKFSNDDLKFALDLLSLHQSPFEIDCANEISQRIERGEWLDINQPPPLHAESVPKWLHVFPFSLLWHQKQR